ncbi:hypothetical protein V6N11_053928 [Hibiscus sabdariffa]|uniref:DUF4283 domain-containing protein n=1 Tax=Hibiscus sabdariffa TaxID=183260 RepID=A0ABR2S379_9ROSI
MNEFSSMEIWVRVYNVPLGWMQQKMGERIGDRFGSTVAVDMRPGDGRWGEYLRIRAKLDISKRLRGHIFVGKREDGSSRACSVKYERLPNFCFWCGRYYWTSTWGIGSASCAKRGTLKKGGC